MRHRGVQVGNFFLAGKEDAPEFSATDEEMLELFASQVATTIVKGREGTACSCFIGAAMRVSPAAFLNRDQPVEEVLEAAGEVTRVTHDHPEGMKGARATAHGIWLAFQGADATQIRRTVEHAYGYGLSRSVDEIRPDYRFDPTCQGTVPEAIRATAASRSSSSRGSGTDHSADALYVIASRPGSRLTISIAARRSRVLRPRRHSAKATAVRLGAPSATCSSFSTTRSSEATGNGRR